MSLRTGADDTRCFLLAYDVADDQRRVKVARLLLRVGNRIQYSVFEVWLAETEIARLLGQIDRIIHPREDRVDVIVICHRCQGLRRRLGAAVPEGRAWTVW